MRFLKIVLPGIFLGCMWTQGLAQNRPTAVDQLLDAQARTGTELLELKASPKEYRVYMIDRCTMLLDTFSEAEIRYFIERLETVNPALARDYNECFVPEISITPVPFQDISSFTRDLLIGRPLHTGQEKGVIGTITTLITIGSTIIKVIRGGDIVYSNGYASVYPLDADWRYFTWNKQVFYTFRYVKKILWGTLKTIDSNIVVSFKYDGQYNGHGLYLGNIQVVGDRCWTAFSHGLNVKAELPPSSVENLTPETPLDPTAAIDFNLTYTTSFLFTNTRTERYRISGDGKLIDVLTGEEPSVAGVTRIDLKK